MTTSTALMGPGTPDNSVRRMAILTRQEEELRRRIAGLHDDLRVMQDKIDDYRSLIADGRDCEDER